MADVLHVDTSDLFCRGVRQALSETADLTVVEDAPCPTEAWDLVEKIGPQLVITDLAFPSCSGLAFVKDVRARWAQLPVLVLTRYDEQLYGRRSLQAGANGYLEKSVASDDLIEAARGVLAGTVFVSDQLRDRFLRQIVEQTNGSSDSVVGRLSDREMEVFRLIGVGQSAGRIAEALHISPKTVHTYRTRIRQKLGLDSSAELVRVALIWEQNN